MGAFSGELKNEQMKAAAKGEAPGFYAAYVTIASATTFKPESSAGPKKIKKTSHGLNTGDVIVFTALNGGAGLVSGRPYYAIKVNANEFEVAWTKSLAEAGTGLEFSTELKETSTTVAKIAEHTGAKTKRKATSFGAITNGVSEDTTAHEVELTSSATITWAMYFSAETSGTFCGCGEIPEKSLTEGDIYRLTNGKLEDNASA